MIPAPDPVSTRVRRGRRGPKKAFAFLALLLLCAPWSRAAAHNQPAPIDRWGPFLPGTPTCLRMISRATHACFDQVLDIEQRCHDALARGEACDQDQVDAEISDATRVTRTALTGSCQEGQLTEISYIGFFDAEADLFSACVTQSQAAIQAIFAPALAGQPTETVARCMTAAGAYARKVIRFALERETPVNERIATRLFTPDEKKAQILRVETELSQTRPRWVAGLTAACPEFATVYGRSADSFIRTMKQRSDCVLSLTYVHSAVSCISQVCGNGIQEATEECDDGNRDDTDTCKSDCTANPAPVGP